MEFIVTRILTEVERATMAQARAYLRGAAHDGTFNRHHGTWRIAQADRKWLYILQILIEKLGSRSWIYREGKRNVWVIETAYRLDQTTGDDVEGAAFARGYFDAEGGLPRSSESRFYLQFVQKNRSDLAQVRDIIVRLGLACGALHNPSARVDPDYWRFYVLSESHADFAARVGSWHPRKRGLLDARVCEWECNKVAVRERAAGSPPF